MSELPKILKAVPLPDKDQRDRFTTATELSTQNSYTIIDPDSQSTWGYISIDNTERGPGLGGIRMVPDLSLNEIRRLARVMTLKNSAACLPYGGAKAGVILKSHKLAEDPALREGLMERLAECLFELPNYAPAPDMGTHETDIQIIHTNHSHKLGTEKHSRGGAGRPVESGGIPIDDWELTSHGLFSAAKALESMDEALDLSRTSFIVQGFGNVGAPIAMKLQQSGAILVGASDIHVALWNPNGLDAYALNKVRKQSGGLINYPLAVNKKFSPDKLDWLLEAPCDILIPSARPDAITAKNADRIQCRYILQGANTPSSKPIEYYLHHRRKILSLTDFIVNAGGVIGCAVERNLIVDDSYADKVTQAGVRTYVENLIDTTITKNVCDTYSRMNNNSDTIFRDAAWELALERLKTQEVWL
ncbi:MAG: Glu/Leu/Phe/Val dehydrogenase [Nitrospinae bacterium]|nr:Glu/Leu/Phe/Val dehydrogenase [Nitrospinota bacterium]MBL7021148.1 Glu/Leu/Phe/Val dehydrogenase [Nitrospinaceae bacterium]